MKKSICTVDLKGIKFWRNNEGQLHREDGPAVESFTGAKEWWIKGKRHRLDGPSFTYSYSMEQWHIDGKKLSQKEFLKHPAVISASKETYISPFTGKINKSETIDNVSEEITEANIAIEKENVPAENKDETIVKILITSKPGELWINLEVLANGGCVSDDIILDLIKALSEAQQFLVDNKAKLRKGDATEIGWGFYEV